MSFIPIPLTAHPQALIDNLNYLLPPAIQANLIIKQHPSILLQPNNTIQLIHDELSHSLRFLMSYDGSQATFNTYRREVERLLQWSWFVRGSCVQKLTRNDIEDYLKFVQSPPSQWVSNKQVARFKTQKSGRIINDSWRPFYSTKKESYLSNKTLQSLFAVISSYFHYLQQEEYVSANPISLIRQKSKYLQTKAYLEPIRRISNLQWDFVIEGAEKMAVISPAEHERTLFIMNCLYAMYLRISELVADERSTPTMSDFYNDADNNWWLKVTGKGNKMRLVSVSDSMIDVLIRYRKYLGLSPLPIAGEQTPLIKKIKGKGAITSTRQIRFIVQSCFDYAYQNMINSGLKDEAQELQSATVHWLRHTGISEDVKHRPKEHVREDAGHASMMTTDRYIDTELRDRHQSARYKKIKTID
jgi:site-specific recombinase XerD